MSLSESILLTSLILMYPDAFMTSSRAYKCASVCQCICADDGCAVECIGKNLRKIPSPLPSNATVINLSNNRLEFIPAMAFSKFKQLKVLRIDDNQLESLHADAFRGLAQLWELSLENNELTLNEKTFASDMFGDFIRVKRLKLRGNKQFNGDYLDNTITKITSLESLYIVGFSGKVFGPQYRRLKELSFIDFSIMSKPSFMKSIPGGVFENLPGLKHVNLSNCRIQTIQKETFSYLQSLKVLDLSYNRRMTFHRLRDALYGLRQVTSLETLVISAIHGVFGLGTEFTVEDAMNLQNTSLKKLNLDSNKLELFQDGALSLFPQTLEYLSIRDNRFSFGWYIFKMYQLPNIRMIDASFKSSQHNLPMFYSRKNTVSNNINLLNSSKIRLEVLWFRECYLKYPIPRINLHSSSMIRFINGSGNVLCPWTGPVIGVENMTTLDLSNNMCSQVSDVFFLNLYSLRKLYIQDNLLGISKSFDGFNTLFKNNTHLKSLKLSNNRIANMSRSSLSNQVYMYYLDLSDNLLKSFSVKIGHMSKLGMLDLSQNLLESISMETAREIQNISLTKNITVNLKRNGLKCSCRHIRFLKWLLAVRQSNTIHVLYDNCVLANETVTSLKGEALGRVVRFLERSCSSFTSLITAATIGILVLIVLLMGGFVYRYRWNLRYFYYMMKHRYSQQKETVENYAFDAFVSYAEDDSEFVINEMLPELEVGGNLRLNIHQRDFIPGRQIVENILLAIQQSRVCLVLLSGGFLLSRWCMYEFSMSKMETIYTGREMVVVVMLEEVDAKSIPLELMHHLKTNSYIQYPREGERENFWNHIKGLLQRGDERD